MKNLRRDFERFCYRHQHKGIPNLMLYIAIGTAIMYIFTRIDPSGLLYQLFRFDRSAILHGQVWRLITYVLLPSSSNILFLAISLYMYYFIGRMIEGSWGTFRFNLFYFSGVLITDLAALLLGANASAGSLNLSLLLAYATIFPENRVLLLFIPIKMKYLAWIYLVLTIYQLAVYPFPINLFPVLALLNYFLFFGSDIQNVLPDFMRVRQHSKSAFFGRNYQRQKPGADWARQYRSKTNEQPYHHKCTVCGRTDATHPDLEFRYCSRCNGYYCYCVDHINNHPHIP